MNKQQLQEQYPRSSAFIHKKVSWRCRRKVYKYVEDPTWMILESMLEGTTWEVSHESVRHESGIKFRIWYGRSGNTLLGEASYHLNTWEEHILTLSAEEMISQLKVKEVAEWKQKLMDKFLSKGK